MSTTLQESDPLSPFTSLTPSIYLVEPRTPPSSSPQSKPKTIILSFWYSAPRRALVKYVQKYAELAPWARIIFILSGPRDFYLYPTLASHRLRLKPATDILVAHQQEDKDDDSVYIHLFSNGGLFSTAHLLLAYKHATGKPLRVSSVILDSSPGKSTPSMSIKALSYALPKTLIIRQIGLAFISAMIWGSFVTGKSWSFILRLVWKRRSSNSKDSDDAVYGDDPLAFTRKAILDRDVIVAKAPAETVDMCYVYSDSDELVPLKDVEEHAALASKMVNGTKKEVRLERFSGSPHVGHMRADPDRYWSIVERYLM